MKGTCFIACSRPPSVPGQIINNCIRPGHILVSGGKKTKTGWRAPVSLQVPDYPRARSDNKQLHGQTYFQTARRQGLDEGHLFDWRFQTTLRARSDNKQLHGASTHFSLRKQERKDWMKGTCFIAGSRPPSVPGQIINNCMAPGHILISGWKKTRTGWRAPVSLQILDHPQSQVR